MDKQIERAFNNRYYRHGFIEEGLYLVLRLKDGVVMLGRVEHNDRGGYITIYYQDRDTSILREEHRAFSEFLVLQKAEIHNGLLMDTELCNE